MPRILTLNSPYRGISRIVNVLQRVGPKQPNTMDDVKVVQELLDMTYRNSDPPSPEIPKVQVSGKYDAVTGFYIFYMQYRGHENRGESQLIDGIISPALGTAYAAKGIWTIVSLNGVAKEFNPGEYAQFFDRWSNSQAARAFR